MVIAKIDLALNDVPGAWEKVAGITTGDRTKIYRHCCGFPTRTGKKI